MTTWSAVNTTQTPSWQSIEDAKVEAFEFAPFATLAFAEGCFADGSTGSLWEGLVTNTTVWTPITT
jgi:hypothetical protein